MEFYSIVLLKQGSTHAEWYGTVKLVSFIKAGF